MTASKRDSTVSATSSEYVEMPEIREKDGNDGGREDCYTVDYASTEALLREQINTTEKNRRKIKRLKSNLCLLIVFLVNNQAFNLSFK